MSSHQNGYKHSQTKDSGGIELERRLENEAVEKASVFQKWQRTYEKEHQFMTWLRAEMDGQDKSLVSTLWFGIVHCISESINMCQVNILWWQVNYIVV